MQRCLREKGLSRSSNEAINAEEFVFGGLEADRRHRWKVERDVRWKFHVSLVFLDVLSQFEFLIAHPKGLRKHDAPQTLMSLRRPELWRGRCPADVLISGPGTRRLA